MYKRQAVDLVRSQGLSIQSIEHQPVSLETVFEHLTEREAPLQAPTGGAGNPGVSTTAPAGLPETPPADVRLRSPLQIALAFLRRDFFNQASYRFAFFLQFFGVLFSVTLFYFLSQLLGDTAAPFLEPYGGDYFSFVLIGIAFSGYFGVGLSSFATSLREAQTTGTLEAMLATPTGLSTIIVSSSLWDYLMTTLRVLTYLLVGAGLMGMDLSGGNLPAALLVLILTVLVFSSLGILSASFVMVLKRGDPVTWMFNGLSTLLGGVYYPITVLPDWLQAISRLLPVTYALEAMRLALLQGASFAELWPNILALLIFGVTLLPASLLIFRYAVRRAKEDGSLTHY